MNSTPPEMPPPLAHQESIDLLHIPVLLWNGRNVIALFAVLSLVVASLYLHLAHYKYTAELTVAPIQSSDSSLASKLGDLSDLASMTGLNLPRDQGSMQFQLYLEGIYSRSVADELSKRGDIMRVIFAGEWDSKTRQWRNPQGALAPVKSLLKAIFGIPEYEWQPPNGARLQLFIARSVKFEQKQKRPVWVITMESGDPNFAVKFLASLHETVEKILHQKAVSTSQLYINYLTGKLTTVTVAEQRLAITNALNEQEKSMMMASSNAPFAAESFGNPSASFRPTSPVPGLVLLFSFLVGVVLGCGYVLLAVLRPLPSIRLPRTGVISRIVSSLKSVIAK